MKKAALLSLVVTVLLAVGVTTKAQQPKKVYRIGFLGPRTAIPEEFKQGLRDLGYVEGKTFLFESRFAEGKFDRFPQLAAELVRLRVDVIATVSTPAARAAKRATTTIPIVMLSRGNPVKSGLVESLSHPGGNITGLTALPYDSDLASKHFELFKEAVPKLSRVAILYDPQRGRLRSRIRESFEHTGKLLGVSVQYLKLQRDDSLDQVFQTAAEIGADGLYAGFRHAPILMGMKRIIALAIKSRLPGFFPERAAVEAGGLMSYGTNYADLYRRHATYVDKILKGRNPSELPVEQPTKFDFVINLKTAKLIGLKIPPNVLARATRVIR